MSFCDLVENGLFTRQTWRQFKKCNSDRQINQLIVDHIAIAIDIVNIDIG